MANYETTEEALEDTPVEPDTLWRPNDVYQPPQHEFEPGMIAVVGSLLLILFMVIVAMALVGQ